MDRRFEEDKTWLVEKNVLVSANDSPFLVPNVLISASDPWVPVSNPSPHPRLIRKGDIIGYLSDPQEYFDAPHDQEEFDKFARSAQAVAAVIAISIKRLHQLTPSKDPAAANPDDPLDKEAKLKQSEEPETFSPKTAELPDLMDYPSQNMEEYLDVGSLPEHLKEKAWQMLKKRQRAFGFDGGEVPSETSEEHERERTLMV